MTNALLGELTDVLNGLHAPNRIWQGQIQTRVFAETLLVQFDGTDDTSLTPELEQCLKTFLEQQEKHKQSALSALLEFYRTQILPMWRKSHFFGLTETQAQQLVPDVQNLNEFEALLSYPRLVLHSANSWGLEFECTWDVEHGAGVLIVDGQVSQTGFAETAFLPS